jgi:hypothetical protein
VLGDGLPGLGVHQMGRYFTKRLQDKAAFRQARMGHDKVSLVDCPPAVQQKVQIHSAWAMMNRSDPLKNFVLDSKQVSK